VPPLDQLQHDPQLQQLLGDAVTAVDAAEGSLLLRPHRSGGATPTLVFAVCISPHADRLLGLSQPLGQGLTGLAAALQQPMLCNDTAASDEHDPTVDRTLGQQTRNQIVCPVSSPLAEYGVVTAINTERPGGFTDDDLMHYQRLAGRLGSRLDQLAGDSGGSGGSGESGESEAAGE
jgi:GAF domain-containing protein